MKKFLTCMLPLLSFASHAQNLFVADTFTYTINLDLSQNLYLKSVPVDLLKGYCKGDWNAYYPKKEMNQCLFDDFLQRFNYSQPMSVNDGVCWDDYCNDPYFKELYSQFMRKIKYREIVYYDSRNTIVKREVLWIQVFFSRQENDGWKHYNGPVFWLREIHSSPNSIRVSNKNNTGASWSLEKEFSHPGFIVNENRQKDDQKKIIKYEKVEEN